MATTRSSSLDRGRSTDRSPTRAPGLLLGLGLGGFIDGIVAHQLFQWHHMVSDTGDHPVDTISGLEANTLADGVFHLGTWVLVTLGVMLMLRSWQQRRPAPNFRFQTGLLLMGWGIFNIVEGLINHQLLGVHHVRDDLGGPTSWDVGFLAFGLALSIAGWALHKAGARAYAGDA